MRLRLECCDARGDPAASRACVQQSLSCLEHRLQIAPQRVLRRETAEDQPQAVEQTVVQSRCGIVLRLVARGWTACKEVETYHHRPQAAPALLERPVARPALIAHLSRTPGSSDRAGMCVLAGVDIRLLASRFGSGRSASRDQ